MRNLSVLSKIRTTHTSRAALAALACLAAIAPLAGTGPVSSQALLVDSSSHTNTVATSAVQPPTNVTATVGSTKITLTWTASTSSWADGYIVYRSASASGPWTQVAAPSGVGTTSWVDTDPLTGTNAYKVVTVRYNWISGDSDTSSGDYVFVLNDSDTFSGSGALGVTEVQGLAWTTPSGATFTRSGGYATTSTAIGSNPMAVIDGKTGDIDATIGTGNAGGGEAIYFRLSNASNWMRARVKGTSSQEAYQYYETEYQHTSYSTEYQWYDNRQVPQWQSATQEVYKTTTSYSYTSWSGWSNTGNTTACRTTFPGYGTFSDYDSYGTEVAQRRWVNSFTCAGGGIQYAQQIRSRSRYSTGSSSSWVSSCSPSDSAYSVVSCGSTRVVASGGTYYSMTKSGTYDYQTGNYQLQSFGTYWAFSRADSDDTATGSTRQVATGTYWDTTFCSGCPTRQAGPYTGYTTVWSYQLVVDQKVAGTISTIQTFTLGSQPSSIRVVAKGSAITGYADGVNVGSTTSTTNQTATLHGIGYGGPTETTPPGITSFSITEAP